MIQIWPPNPLIVQICKEHRENQKHAIIEKDGFKVPLIGVPGYAVIEECDCCGEEIGLTDAIVSDNQILCKKCAK